MGNLVNSSNHQSGDILCKSHAKFEGPVPNIKHHIGQTIMAMQQKIKSTEKWAERAIITLRRDRCSVMLRDVIMKCWMLAVIRSVDDMRVRAHKWEMLCCAKMM